MIFNLYPRVAVKLGDERYEFDRSSLMFKEVLALEEASGYSYGEWESELRRYSIRAVAALIHILRKRAGVASDFETLDFAADQLDVVPLHDDGSEFTAAEIADDIMRRAKEAQDPTAAAASGNGSGPPTTASTSPTSPGSTASSPGSSGSSPGGSSSGSKQKPTKT